MEQKTIETNPAQDEMKSIENSNVNTVLDQKQQWPLDEPICI